MKLARLASVSRVLLEEGLGWLTQDHPAEGSPSSEAETAARLRRTLERLGPTFVKFGQLLSTRVDLFGEAFVAELARLQAEVEPFDTAEARRILERELGRPVEEVFEELPDAPVAAASIAQVYRARARGVPWPVAVKVQRPGLEESLLSDLDGLLSLSGVIDRLVPPYHRSLVHRVAEEYARRARAELDFAAEARAMERFAGVLATVPGFRVPRLVPHLCTPRVLVMEWIEGPRLAEVKTPEELAALGYDPRELCRSLLRLQLSMCYEHGFVHGDTHPGNLLLPGGEVALIDFGLHAQLPQHLRDQMLEVVFSQASGRVDEAVDAFVEVFHPDPSVDLQAFRAELAEVLARGGERGALKDHRVTEQLVRGMRVGARHRLRAQSDLFMVLRNLTLVEGIVLRYDPTSDVAREVEAIAGEILRRRLLGAGRGGELEQVWPQLALTLSRRPRTAERWLKLERAFQESKSLGEFLRQQGVIRDPPPAPSPVAGWLAGLLAGLGLGLALGLWLGRG